jgi:general secretion pathway protein A
MYLQHFGLREAPFSIAPNPRFVYLSARHQDAFAHLLAGLSGLTGGGFVALTGAVGSGKTTLCRLLLKDLDPTIDIAWILNPTLDPKALIDDILRELGHDQPSADLRAAQRALNTLLLERHARGRRVVVLIDEAQALPRESLEQLRLLTNLETDEHKLLQVVLVGQPELAATLKDPSLSNLDQRITARFHLDALDLDETGAYLNHRLRVAGTHRELFSGAAVRALHGAARGIPRVINAIAERALMAAYARGADKIGAPLIRAAAREVGVNAPRTNGAWGGAIAALGLVAAIGAGYVMLNQSSPAPPSAAPRPVLATALAPVDLSAALVELARRWEEPKSLRFADGQRAAGIAAFAGCANDTSAGLRCAVRSGSLAAVRALNRPALLDTNHGPQLLLAADDDSALVFAEPTPQRVELSELLSHYRGRYVSFYQAPAEIDEAWIAARLKDWQRAGAHPDARRAAFRASEGLRNPVDPALEQLLLARFDPRGPTLRAP